VNKLSKVQRDQLIGIAAATVVFMAALWYFGVLAKQSELKTTRQKSADMQQKLREAEALMRRGDEISGTLHTRSELLARREAGLAPDRDAYAWLIDTINGFVQSHKGVNIDTYSQPEVSDVGIVPLFPYRWATFHLKGAGYYHDCGRFLADFENAFPYYRIQNLNLSANAGAGTEAEKLSMTFDLVAPVASSGLDTK
jgi:hypothetical protein